jgi:hypothetical protein
MLPNVQASAAAYGNCVGGNTLPNVQDCFTFELSRSAAHCWPKYANFETAVEALGRNSFAMLDEQTLDIDNGNTICQLGEDLEFLIKPSVRRIFKILNRGKRNQPTGQIGELIRYRMRQDNFQISTFKLEWC